MQIETIRHEKLNETMYKKEFESGLTAYVLPKKGFTKQYAIFATNYGSIDNKFKAPGDNEYTEVPDGIAHFLEHKLFEQEDENAFEKYARLGSSPNAYTNYNTTAYLFMSTDKFMENLEILLDFVQNPYLTDENVEKEKGIIGQEIKMYDDDPNSKVFQNLLSAMYVNNSIRIDIAGTVESISKIDKETLYKCYNTFYHPSNMVFFAAGDIDYNKVFELIEKKVKKPKQGKIEKPQFDEPKNAGKEYIESKLSVSIPLFQIGFKDPEVGLSGEKLLKKTVLSNLVLDAAFGKSSDLYQELYNEGLINDSFGSEFIGEERYCLSVLGGESKDPQKVKEKIVEAVNKLKNQGIDSSTFERMKKMNIGRFLKQFDNIESIAHAFISLIFDQIMIFDVYDMLDEVTLEELNEKIKIMFDLDKMTLSVINPV